ncbi:hypothetical protein MCOR27_011174 [Pyricularia oryzae]|uniref:RRM domain-containing protein n=1 Tax=Pyricularia grisea TaxID=148305 RepID=A0ABQ8NN18_PYRGI|nr:hypothetical protein MCOR27_011174 [Pyricularia oryzae]KAI6299594.1 hypothetical protein MCOR33_004503 [Pyricularia grisea]
MSPVNPLLCSSSSSSSLVSLCLPSGPNTAKGEMANTMDSSRIFVRNLPPNITEADFRKHFASKGQEITDLKLIPKRRIGYVGFKSPQLAADAAKYYNRSYIRMSKIAVEIARPISDPSLPASKKVVTAQAIVAAHTTEKEAARAAKPEAESAPKKQKRKRDELDMADPKLKEYLETMNLKPGGAAAESSAMIVDADQSGANPNEALVGLENESDDEYEEIPARPVKRQAVEAKDATAAAVKAAPAEVLPPSEAPAPQESADASAQADVKPANDDDWLRSRTNRLLDLVDPDDPKALQPVSVDEGPAPVLEVAPETDQSPQDDVQEEQTKPVPEKVQKDDPVESVRKTSRLFVRNLPYSATEDDLKSVFGAFGPLDEIHLSHAGREGTSKGIAFIQYSESSSAVDAFQKLDGCDFQGRILHVLPGQAKRVLDEYAISQLPLKKQQQIKRKAEAATKRFNWNALYMSQDAVNAAVAERLGVSKSALFDPASSDAGVKQAIAETSTIEEVKSYFASNGVDLDAFRHKERGDTTILVKNFSHGTTLDELKKTFEDYGPLTRVLMPPSATIAIVQFSHAAHAKTAFKKLAYSKFKSSLLYLEMAPKDVFKNVPEPTAQEQGKQKLSVTELLERDDAEEQGETTSLFVKGLNFATTTEKLAETFQSLEGFVSATVKTKTDPKKPGQVLSMGFGFVEFRSKELAQAALKVMDNYNLEGHTLTVRASHRGLDAAEERRREDKAKKQAGQRTKIVVKNLPFEATKKDVRTLFGTYGQLRSVRVPKNFENRTRGFAFAEFTTPKEAENALNALKNTHLLGRKLVLDFAEAEAVDAEEEIAKMQKKTEGQANKVALQNLIGKGRKKVTIGQDEEGDEM